jgi:signal transduction histidine kinase
MLGFVSMPGPASAAAYGIGSYSRCVYQVGCIVASPAASASPMPVTIQTTNGGLRFAVNLADGQVLKHGDYLVKVTPLNGEGRSFARVEFYIDGALADAAPSTPTGTFSWQWSMPGDGTHKVRVVAYEDGVTDPTTQEFTVVVEGPGLIARTGEAVAAIIESTGSAVTQVTEATTRAAQAAVRQLPLPVVVAFPYLLLVLLGLGLGLLVIQARQELALALVMETAITRGRAVAADKDMFVQLASHYLRTPVTLASGALDLGLSLKEVQSVHVEKLRGLLTALHVSVEQMLDEILSIQVTARDGGVGDHLRVWLRPGFFVPLVLLGGLTLTFNAVVASVGRLSGGVINWMTQAALFGVLATALYMLVRGRVLRSRDRTTRQRVIDEQVRVDEAKNKLIHAAAGELNAAASQVRAELPGLGDNETSRQLRNGCERLEQMTTEFTMAAQLESGREASALETIDLDRLVRGAVRESAEMATRKDVSIQRPGAGHIQGPHPDWLQAVLASLVDNAVAYSPAHGRVEIVFERDEREAVVTVTDHGQGVAADDLERLFRPFSKAEGGLVYDHEGLGFSLYLDKLIMTYLGGSISLKSEVGSGTAATIRFPNI